MSSQNREEKSFGDWLYYTKKKGNKTITPCSAIIMENKQELDNWKKELYESYSQEKHRYIKKNQGSCDGAQKSNNQRKHRW